MYSFFMRVFITNSGQVKKPFLEHITLMKGNVCTQDVDAVATLLPQNMDFTGDVNHALAALCGYDLDEFILTNVIKPKIGEVYALPGGELSAKHIFIGIIPHYRTDFDRKESDLVNVVRNIMELARCMLISSIAFPSMGKNSSGFPDAKAARLVTQGITDRMHEEISDVRIVCPRPDIAAIYQEKLKSLGWLGGKAR